MPDYSYVAVDLRGRERRGTVRAANDIDARRGLESRKLYVVKVASSSGEARAATGAAQGFLRRKARLSAKQLTLFTRQLATISQVSPLEEALRTIARQSEQEHVRAIVGRVADAIVEGRRLGEALSREPKSFPPTGRARCARRGRRGASGSDAAAPPSPRECP